ncbi:unnamed protein product [Coregonus sp. 'balchen']|nr:unnamed protein product [Coregonus sp. 'balchen']
MIPLGSLGMLPLLSLCVGAVLSPPDAPPACSHPPCRDNLVAAPPARTGSGGCEGSPGTAGCRVVVAPLAASNPPLREEHRQEVRQVQLEAWDVSERLVQLQRCLHSLQEPGAPRGQGGDTLGAILALMAAAECDMETAGGGWTMFQRRRDGSVDFNRTWQEYREGFGSPQGEHWLGNAELHALTNTGQHLLHIQLEDWHKQKRQATYNTFRVAAEAQNKRYNHDGRAFSTNDRDHDRYTSGNCAQYYGAGWWFDACLAANPNGRYYRGRYSGLTNGIYWGTWYILTDSRSGERYSFKSVEMKTRPRNF